MAKRKSKASSKSSGRAPFSSDSINPQKQWDAYKTIERQINAAWVKLQNDIQKKASRETLLDDRNHLMLLLGECNYMAREWTQWIDYKPKKSRG